ncbi:CBS domain-containing protein [Thermococcus sp. M39]|uniref:CBS domain-containing protein n=1 Tax=unclassified Thermococcus TaxID=2627626 RepID=UPI001438B2DD|nr:MULTISPECIES: CBS domain-containing protein [unclassified Thermococcus]NJE07736.1 CBS domain-containing protein [Thermococcus sp. M39]NJE12292.1 CBS domain-containing protein [Thermococcus sp. LS2]
MSEVERALQTFHSLKVKQVMPPLASMPIVTVDSSILDVLKLLKTRHHVWVVNNKEEMKLEGVIRYINVVDVLLPPETHKARFGNISHLFKSILGGADRAEHVMERNVLTINEDATVLDALTKMKRYKVPLLAIVDQDERLVGEISLRILVNEFIRLMRIGGAQWSQSGSSSHLE